MDIYIMDIYIYIYIYMHICVYVYIMALCRMNTYTTGITNP